MHGEQSAWQLTKMLNTHEDISVLCRLAAQNLDDRRPINICGYMCR